MAESPASVPTIAARLRAAQEARASTVSACQGCCGKPRSGRAAGGATRQSSQPAISGLLHERPKKRHGTPRKKREKSVSGRTLWLRRGASGQPQRARRHCKPNKKPGQPRTRNRTRRLALSKPSTKRSSRRGKPPKPKSDAAGSEGGAPRRAIRARHPLRDNPVYRALGRSSADYIQIDVRRLAGRCP